MINAQLTKIRHISLAAKIISLVPILSFVGLVLFILSISIGPVNISFYETISILTNGFVGDLDVDEVNRQVITNIRLPRILIALLVGSALSVSGATLQGIFKNPMADPSIIGVSSGAATGAVVTMALGISSSSIFLLPLFSFLGGISAALLVFTLTRVSTSNSNMSFILSGLAIATFLNSIISLILVSTREFGELTAILNWLAGGLQDTRWDHVFIMLPIFVLCMPFFLFYSHKINILSLSDDSASSLGLDVSRTRFVFLVLTTLLVSISVAICGIIAFIGIMIPHIVRLITGPDNRIVIPISAIFGAVFILAADFISRTLMVPYEIRLGIITSFIGAPYFIFLIIKQRKTIVER